MPTTAIIDVGPSILVNSAYLAGPYQVTALGPEDLYPRLSASPGFVDLIRARAQGYGIRVSVAEPEAVDVPAFVGHRHAALRAARVRDDDPVSRRRNQLTIAAVTFAARAARRRPAPDAGEQDRLRRAVVAGPDRPRGEPQRPQRPAPRPRSRRSSASSQVLDQNTERGDASVDELRADLRRVRLYAGIDPADRARACRSRSAARSTGRASRTS